MSKKVSKSQVPQEVAPAQEVETEVLSPKIQAIIDAEVAKRLALVKKTKKVLTPEELEAKEKLDAENAEKREAVKAEIQKLKDSLKLLGGRTGGGMTGLVKPKSISGAHASIRHLIEELFLDSEGNMLPIDKIPSYAVVEEAVKAEFPDSAFKKTHYSWYLNKIRSGDVRKRK